MKTLLRAALMGAVVSFAGLGLSAAGALAQEAPSPGGMPPGHQMMAHGPMLNLSAFGEVKVAPDMASITTGVSTEALTAAEAMRLNREKMTAVVAALRRQGVDQKDIQTSGLNLSPQYTYRDNQPPLLRGYQASNNVSVTVYNLERLGAVVDAVVASGANQINGVNFGLKESQAAQDDARRAAVRALKAKADLYAQATGMRIKGLRALTEGGGYEPPRPMYRALASNVMDSAESTPIEPGQLTVRIDISGVYELE
jgi:uncharacterized protein YggE